MIYTALLISLASLGFRAITGKGMILYFLRAPFDKISKRNSEWKRITSLLDSNHKNRLKLNQSTHNASERNRINVEIIHLQEELSQIKKPSKHSDLILYIMKPFILCSTCMASIHTLIWFPIITGEMLTYKLILVMLMVALLNTLIWSIVEMVQKLTEALQKTIDFED